MFSTLFFEHNTRSRQTAARSSICIDKFRLYVTGSQTNASRITMMDVHCPEQLLNFPHTLQFGTNLKGVLFNHCKLLFTYRNLKEIPLIYSYGNIST